MTKTQQNSLGGLLRAIGPGILMAGAAIGVSHVVQSTRAGASYGLEIIWLVLLVNILKYPFFEAGHRYTVATGETLLDGYKRLGKGFLYGFLALNSFTAVISIAGVTFVTAILTPKIGPLADLRPQTISAGLLVLILLLLSLGSYKWLDRIIKVMMFVLFVATVAAFFKASSNPNTPVEGFIGPELWTIAALPFLIALMGWMPAPIELSVWQSLWLKACEEERKEKITRSQATVDFHVGYIMTTLLALMFVALGAWVMYGSGEQFAASSVGFTNQFVNLYTTKLGEWTRWIIEAAAFTTLLSTSITVIDAYPRSLAAGIQIARPSLPKSARFWHILMISICSFIGWLIITFSSKNLTTLIDLITTAAFLTGPVFAYLNLRLVLSDHMPKAFRLNLPRKVLAWVGLAYLVGFSALFIWWRLFLKS